MDVDVDLTKLQDASAESVATAFQLPFDAPEAFVRFVDELISLSRTAGESPNDLYDQVLGLYPRGFYARYDSTPAEFFPIGSTGMDGEHIGFINRAPEWKPVDLPMAFITPAGAYGAFCIGETVQSGFERLLSVQLSICDEQRHAKWMRDLASAARFTVDPEAVGECGPFYCGPALLRDGEPLRIPVEAVDGYHFQATADGIGVLAPMDKFSPNHDFAKIQSASLEDLDIQIQDLTDAGQTGTALSLVKQLHYAEGELDATAFSNCYRDLGRPELVEVIEHYGDL